MRPDARQIGWTALTLGCLLVGAIAVTARGTGEGPAMPASRIVVDLPGWLTTSAGTAGALAILLFFAFVSAVSRRRRKLETGRAGLVGGVLVPLVLAVLIASNQGFLERMRLDDPARPENAARSDEATGRRDLPPVSVPLFTTAVGVLALAGGLGALALVAWFLVGDRVGRWWSAALAARSPLAEAVDNSLEDLRQEPDARAAIIRCYGRFERVLARSRVPRRPWQTPTELMREAMARLPVPAAAVGDLTRLFELARFSEEPLGERERDAAWQALAAIRGSLEQLAGPAPAAAAAADHERAR
jgi:hypothetical protein